MAKNGIARLRKAAGLSQRALAEKLGSHWVTVSKLERGEMQLTMEWADRLSEVLNATFGEVTGRVVETNEVEIYGIIDDLGGVSPPPNLGVTIPLTRLPGLEGAFSRWIFLNSNVFFPVLHKGDLLKFLFVPVEDYKKYYDRVCSVVHDGGLETAGILGPPRGDGVVSIRPLNGPAIEVQRLESFGALDEIHTARMPDDDL